MKGSYSTVWILKAGRGGILKNLCKLKVLMSGAAVTFPPEFPGVVDATQYKLIQLHFAKRFMQTPSGRGGGGVPESGRVNFPQKQLCQLSS